MICTSLKNSSEEKCRASVKESEMVEVRLDLPNPGIEFIKSLCKEKRPLIITPGILFEKSEKKKSEFMSLIDSEPEYIDIDINTDDITLKSVIKKAEKKNTRVILSFHNFSETPDTETLKVKYTQAIARGADLVKIVPFCNSSEDAGRILSLYSVFPGKKLIAFGMGTAGRITRVASLFLGSPFTYASADSEEKTAPGQYTAAELRKIADEIKNV